MAPKTPSNFTSINPTNTTKKPAPKTKTKTKTKTKKAPREILPLPKTRQPLGALAHNVRRPPPPTVEVIDLSAEDEDEKPERDADGDVHMSLSRARAASGKAVPVPLNLPQVKVTAAGERYFSPEQAEGSASTVPSIYSAPPYPTPSPAFPSYTNTPLPPLSANPVPPHTSTLPPLSLTYPPPPPRRTPVANTDQYSANRKFEPFRYMPPPRLSRHLHLNDTRGFAKYQVLPVGLGALNLARGEKEYKGDGFVDQLVANDMDAWKERHAARYRRQSEEFENDWPEARIFKQQ